MFLKNVKRFLVQFVMLSIIVAISILFLPQIENFTKRNIPALYYRVFVKTELFLSGKSPNIADADRLKNMNEFVNNLKDYIVPKGFVSRRTAEDKTGVFIDFPLSEMFYMFGAIGAILILSMIALYTIGCYYHYYNNRDDSIIFVVLSLIMFMLLFLEGTFLSSSYVAPVTGYCLGRLKYHSKMFFIRRGES